MEGILLEALVVEIVSSIKGIVPEIFEERTVELVGAALCDNIHDTAGAAAIFGFEVGSDVQLGDGFHWKDCGRSTKYACLVDGGVIAVPVIHVCAVKEEVV